MDAVEEEIIASAVVNGNCPDCGNFLDHPRQEGEKIFNQDQWESLTTDKFCRRCEKCWCEKCRVKSP